MGRTFAGSHVDRGHRWEEIRHFIPVFVRKQACRKQLQTLDGWPCRRPTDRMAAADDRSVSSSHIPVHYTDKAPDGVRSAISIQQDGALHDVIIRSAIGCFLFVGN